MEQLVETFGLTENSSELKIKEIQDKIDKDNTYMSDVTNLINNINAGISMSNANLHNLPMLFVTGTSNRNLINISGDLYNYSPVNIVIEAKSLKDYNNIDTDSLDSLIKNDKNTISYTFNCINTLRSNYIRCLKYLSDYLNYCIDNNINYNKQDNYTLKLIWDKVNSLYYHVDNIDIIVTYTTPAGKKHYSKRFNVKANYILLLKHKEDINNIINGNIQKNKKALMKSFDKGITNINTENRKKNIKICINMIKNKINILDCKTEEATKNWFIIPLIQSLGYDTSTDDVLPEYTCDVGIKTGEKVDYAIQCNGKIVILIECKKINKKLTDENISQLYRYYAVSDAKIAILTNGKIYKFFTDSKKQNIMDLEPYFEFDITNIKDSDIDELVKYSKEYLSI